MSERPFSLLRAGFLLIATVALIAMLETLLAVAGCVWLIAVTQTQPVGGCGQLQGTLREIMSELLTAILALIAASRGSPPKE